MQKVLDFIVEVVGFLVKSYGDLIIMVVMWKKIFENFDSYEKVLYYGICGFFMKKLIDDIKKMVDKESDVGMLFLDDGYLLVKILVDDIKYLFV